MELLQIKNLLIKDEILCLTKKLNSDDWYIFTASLIEKSCYKLLNENQFNININYTKGLKLDDLCFRKLRSQCWEVKQTPFLGDQGVDLITSIDRIRLRIQCKDDQ